jgi:hypothetical protein
MKLDRLFNVLVLGGAALVTGCSDEGGDAVGQTAGSGGDAPSTSTPGAGGAGTSNSSSTTGTGGGASQSEAGAQGGAGRGGGEPQSDAGSHDGGGSGDSTLVCSPTPSASDPCGCPCCWVSNCINTDECCKGLSPCSPR